MDPRKLASSTATSAPESTLTSAASPIPFPVLVGLRGIGQVFFQENALSGALFVAGIAVGSPLMALGAVVGSAIGTVTAWQLGFDRGEVSAGIYGFNSALVGIATFFFFRPTPLSVGLMLLGCIAAALLTRWMRRHVPFPTYTTPFVVTAWVLFFLGRALGAGAADSAAAPLVANLATHPMATAAAHGISQVMFQASVWTGLLFLVGIAVNERLHAAWVLAAAVLGMLVASYHLSAGASALDPERLVDRAQFENIALGLYGYNATLAAVALSLWRRSLIPPLLGILLSVPLTELVPLFGLPALTAPFVLATWLVMTFGWMEGKFFDERAVSA
jgi:urea transporter